MEAGSTQPTFSRFRMAIIGPRACRARLIALTNGSSPMTTRQMARYSARIETFGAPDIWAAFQVMSPLHPSPIPASFHPHKMLCFYGRLKILEIAPPSGGCEMTASRQQSRSQRVLRMAGKGQGRALPLSAGKVGKGSNLAGSERRREGSAIGATRPLPLVPPKVS